MKNNLILLLLVLVSLTGCSQNSKKNDTSNSDTINYKEGNDNLIKIIESIVNLPEVIKYSKAEKKSVQYYIYLDNLNLSIENGFVLQNKDTLVVLKKKGASNVPCYTFDKIDVHGETAFIRMFFNNGLIAVGNLEFSNGTWKPLEGFRIGFN